MNTPQAKKRNKPKEEEAEKNEIRKQLNQTKSQRHFVYIFKSVYGEQHFAIISK